MSKSLRASPGASMAFSDRCTVRSALVKPPVSSPHRGRQDDVGELDRLCHERVGDDEKQAILAVDRADALQLRQRHKRICRRHPEESDRAGIALPKNLHRMSRRRLVRYPENIDIPCLGDLAHVLVVLPFPIARERPVGAVSRVFSAVGCPFIWKTLAPGRPIMSRKRLTLLTCTAAAVAWFD